MLNGIRPNFRLERIYMDGTWQKPEIFTIKDLDGGWQMGRRGFVFTAAAGLAVGLGLLGCSSNDDPDKKSVGAKCPGKMLAHFWGVSSIAFSNNGKLLVSGGQDSKLKLWEMPSCKLLKTIWAHKKSVNSICFHPDGRQVASGSSDKTIRIWDTASGDMLQKLETEAAVRTVLYCPDGKTLVSASYDGELKIWNVSSWEPKKVSEVFRPVTAMAFTPDGRKLVIAENDKPVELIQAVSKLDFLNRSIRIVDMNTRKISDELGWPRFVTNIFKSKKFISSIAVSPDARLLAVSKGKNIELWNLKTREKMDTLSGARAYPSGEDVSIDAIAFSFSGKWLASLSAQESNRDIEIILELWDVATSERTQTLVRVREKKSSSYIGGPSSVCFSPDESILSAGFPDGTIRVWELPSGQHLTCLFDPDATVQDVKVAQYTMKTHSGKTIIRTEPCGTKIPSAAVCTCNCVSGRVDFSTGGGSWGGGTSCTCNQICTCIPIK